MNNTPDYIKYAEKPFPFRINWVVVAGERKLDVLEEFDIVFDEKDLKIREIYLPDPKKPEAIFIDQITRNMKKYRKPGLLAI